MRVTSKTKNLNKRQINKIVNMTVLWCQINMGENNRRKSKFKISVCKQYVKKEKLMGSFDQLNNLITVHHNNCHNIKELVSTTIHEYTHYLQPILTYYGKLYKSFGYEKHPMEIEAANNEKLYVNCWKEIKNNL
jgi:hypothetical protein